MVQPSYSMHVHKFNASGCCTAAHLELVARLTPCAVVTAEQSVPKQTPIPEQIPQSKYGSCSQHLQADVLVRQQSQGSTASHGPLRTKRCDCQLASNTNKALLSWPHVEFNCHCLHHASACQIPLACAATMC